MSYIGNEPIVSATRTITEIVATAGQTIFVANGGYTVGFIDVFVNGAQLQTNDFTATNGSSITLISPASTGDDIRLVAWGTFSTSTALSATNPSYSGTLTGGTGVVNIGSGQLYKDASGNVGIGTASPAGKLHTAGTGTFQASGGKYANIIPNADAAIFAVATSGGNATGNNYLYLSDTSNFAAFVTNGNERLRIDSSGNLLFNSGYGSVATAYGCRAWVSWTYFSSTLAIQASGNVSSVTRSGAGVYVVNLSTAMPDNKYSAVVTPSFSTSSAGIMPGIYGTSGAPYYTAPSTSSFNINFATGGGAFQDPWYCNVAVFR